MLNLPANEYGGYDEYAAQVVTLLREGADELWIADHLTEPSSCVMVDDYTS
jgi:hypothetical protein